jgi:hypothetical protein
MYSKIVPPFLLAEELIHMGQECGFDDKEEGELLEGLARWSLMDKLPLHWLFSGSELKWTACICIRHFIYHMLLCLSMSPSLEVCSPVEGLVFIGFCLVLHTNCRQLIKFYYE